MRKTNFSKRLFVALITWCLLFNASSCKKNSSNNPNDFSYSGSLMAGDTITFQITATTQNNAPAGTSFSWNFGDDSTSTGTETRHVYYIPGTYVITLFINSSTIRKTVIIVDPPGAQYTYLMAGIRKWHVNISPFMDTSTTGNDTSFSIHYINDVMVSIGNINIEYDGFDSSENILFFGCQQDLGYYHNYYSIYYYVKKDSISFDEQHSKATNYYYHTF